MTMRRSGFLFTNRGARAVARAEGSRLRREGGALGSRSRGGRAISCRAGLQACLLLLALALCAPAFAQEPADLVEGRRLFDALEYDQALPFLDRAIGLLEPQAARDPGQPHRAHLRVRDARPRAFRHGQPRGRRHRLSRAARPGARLHAGRRRLAARRRDSRRGPRRHDRLHRVDARSRRRPAGRSMACRARLATAGWPWRPARTRCACRAPGFVRSISP